MKLALCTEILYPLYGVERRVYEFASRLPKYGIEVEIFTSTSQKYFKKLHITQVSHPTIVNPPRRNYAFCVDYMVNLFRHLMRGDYDMINAEGHLSLAPCSAAGVMRKKPVVATIHDLYLAEWRGMYKGKAALVGGPFELASCKMPFSVIITVNSALKMKMEKMLKIRNVEILHSGIDTKYLDSIRGAKKDGSIVYVSRLAPQKNVDTLIRAYALLPEKIRREHALRIIGEGSERQHLEALAKSLRVEVEFTGKVENHEDVIRMLKAASLFILPSRRESFGITIMESMYCGIPVISTATEGPSDHVVNGENGFLVPVGDEAGLSGSMMKVLSDGTLQKALSKNARKYASRHDWDNIAKRVAGIYRRTAEGI